MNTGLLLITTIERINQMCRFLITHMFKNHDIDSAIHDTISVRGGHDYCRHLG
jgi:hypothetical protein